MIKELTAPGLEVWVRSENRGHYLLEARRVLRPHDVRLLDHDRARGSAFDNDLHHAHERQNAKNNGTKQERQH
ncbi:MAG: hypothetical protein E6G06_21975 [Actinobacteria bacterium]|nr:MAG: hypothetical protein E6G06_21975 [Actinomycetota bacterium]